MNRSIVDRLTDEEKERVILALKLGENYTTAFSLVGIPPKFLRAPGYESVRQRHRLFVIRIIGTRRVYLSRVERRRGAPLPGANTGVGDGSYHPWGAIDVKDTIHVKRLLRSFRYSDIYGVASIHSWSRRRRS